MNYILWLLVLLIAAAVIAARALADLVGWPLAFLVVGLAAVVVLGLYGWVWQWVRSRERLIIQRPVAEVFQAVVDALSRRGQPVEAAEGHLAPGPIGVGTTRRAAAEYRKRPLEWIYTVTVFEQDRRFAFQGTTLPPLAQTKTAYTFTPSGAGTQVTVVHEYRFVGLRRILNPFIAFRIYDRNKTAILNLKQMVEAAPD